MARTGVTFEQVSATADALAGEGKTPSITAVREKLGTGSPNTMARGSPCGPRRGRRASC